MYHFVLKYPSVFVLTKLKAFHFHFFQNLISNIFSSLSIANDNVVAFVTLYSKRAISAATTCKVKTVCES